MKRGPEETKSPRVLKCYNFKKGASRRLRCVGERPPGLRNGDPSNKYSTYASIEELARVVRLPANISVTDDKTRSDITGAMLLKVLEYFEQRAPGIMSNEFLYTLIRCQEPRPMLRAFLDHSLRSFPERGEQPNK